jgi:hypothetical protein
VRNVKDRVGSTGCIMHRVRISSYLFYENLLKSLEEYSRFVGSHSRFVNMAVFSLIISHILLLQYDIFVPS